MADVSSSSSSSVAVAAPITSTVNVINNSSGHPLSTVLTVKLEEKNYLLWRGMVLAILRGQKVDGFILGIKAQSPEFIEVTTETEKRLEPNPLYEEWITIDQALCGWLFGSMTPAIVADVVSFKTSREVWKALEKVFIIS